MYFILAFQSLPVMQKNTKKHRVFFYGNFLYGNQFNRQKMEFPRSPQVILQSGNSKEGRAVVECLFETEGFACSSLTSVTALCFRVRHI